MAPAKCKKSGCYENALLASDRGFCAHHEQQADMQEHSKTNFIKALDEYDDIEELKAFCRAFINKIL